MKRIVVDLDDTLTVADSERSYETKAPNEALVQRLRDFKADGFEIIVQTARNMRTYNNSVGKINAYTLPTIIKWLEQNNVPFDEVHVGKPWCGHDGFYVDDKAIRPAEFLKLNHDQICRLLDRDR